jgi:hypothetical protein
MGLGPRAAAKLLAFIGEPAAGLKTATALVRTLLDRFGIRTSLTETVSVHR